MDPRLMVLAERVCPLIKAKTEMFAKLVAAEDTGDILRKFVSEESMLMLFFTAGAKDMTVTDKLPDSKAKKKHAFCLKTQEVKYTENKLDEMYDTLVFGDMSPQVLHNYHTVMSKVYLPILTNPTFQRVSRARSRPKNSNAPPRPAAAHGRSPLDFAFLPHAGRRGGRRSHSSRSPTSTTALSPRSWSPSARPRARRCWRCRRGRCSRKLLRPGKATARRTACTSSSLRW